MKYKKRWRRQDVINIDYGSAGSLATAKRNSHLSFHHFAVFTYGEVYFFRMSSLFGHYTSWMQHFGQPLRQFSSGSQRYEHQRPSYGGSTWHVCSDIHRHLYAIGMLNIHSWENPTSNFDIQRFLMMCDVPSEDISESKVIFKFLPGSCDGPRLIMQHPSTYANQ